MEHKWKGHGCQQLQPLCFDADEDDSSSEDEALPQLGGAKVHKFDMDDDENEDGDTPGAAHRPLHR